MCVINIINLLAYIFVVKCRKWTPALVTIIIIILTMTIISLMSHERYDTSKTNILNTGMLILSPLLLLAHVPVIKLGNGN